MSKFLVKNLKFLAAIGVVFLLGGCSTATSTKTSPSASSESSNAKSPWDCKTEEDGLGEKHGCQTISKDAAGTTWILTIMCTSDLQMLHSIYGLTASVEDVKWDTDQYDVAKVRIDSGAISEWKYQSKGNGSAIVFSSLAGAGKDEGAATWKLLTKIASAKQFGFKAFDADGNVRSAKFDVSESVPIAASFSAYGCE